MDTTYILELLKAVRREVAVWRVWLVAVFIAVAFVVLGFGMTWSEKFETSTLLYTDVTNIIAPLLAGRAEVTNIDHSQQARDLIYGRNVLNSAVKELGLVAEGAGVEAQEKAINSLRAKIKVKNEGKNYFRVSYLDESQELSFTVLNKVVDAFIRNSSNRRRKESRDAYEFIENQVVSYKQQLISAESLLKEFKSKNTDGDLAGVNSRIGQLRINIEELKLVVGEIEAEKYAVRQQLKNETELLDNKNEVDKQRTRLNLLNGQLDTLRLSYQETYPDIVSLKEQVKAQELVIEAIQGSSYTALSSSGSLENPLYEELRKRKAEVEVNLLSQRRRLQSLEKMLEGEYARAERVAFREADLSELVRDYDVNRELYEEMLGRKEKARLSMVLDIEGQGVSYKIREQSVYPLHPSGLRFEHFVLAGPFAAFMCAICLVVAYVFVDARVRSPSQLVNELPPGVELLSVVPHVNTVLSKRLLRADMLMIAVVLIAAAGVYSALVWGRLSELI